MPAKSTHTPRSSYRLPAVVLERADEIAKHLGTTRTEVLNLGTLFLYDQLGLKRQDAVLAVEGVVREYGDDAPVVATITNLARGDAALTIAGEPAPDWAAWVLAAHAEGIAPTPGALYARHDPSGAHFALGLTPEPAADGASVTVRAADLVDLVMQRSTEGRTPAELRRDLRGELELRRRLRQALAEPEGDDDE